MTKTSDVADLPGLAQELNRLVSRPAPPARIDIMAAQRAGRRMRRSRMGGVAVAGAAVVTAVAVLAPTAFPGTSVAPRPAADASTPPTGPKPLPAKVVLAAAFGWLPPGYAVHSVLSDDQNGVANEQQVATVSSYPKNDQIALTVYPDGPEPDLGYYRGGIPAKRLPAAPVKGHGAYWLTKPGGQTAELRWRYTTNGWADLQVSGAPGSNAATVYKIAESVSFARSAEPVRFPVKVTGLPSVLRPVRTTLNTGGNIDVSFNFQISGSASSTAQQQQSNWLSISLTSPNNSPGMAHLKDQVRPNTIIAGHRAWDSRLPQSGPASPGRGPFYVTPTDPPASRGETVWIFDFDGYALNLSAGANVRQLLQPTGGLNALIQHITPIQGPRSSWTTTPFD